MLSEYHRACHPERSEAQSKDLAEFCLRSAMGFLDFARNDVGKWLEPILNDAPADR